MNIQFCLVVNTKEETVLANGYTYEPGYNYSEYTRQDAYTSVNPTFTEFKNILGPRYDCDGYTPIIFESEDAANKWIENRFYDEEDQPNIKVLTFAEFNEIAEKVLLDK